MTDVYVQEMPTLQPSQKLFESRLLGSLLELDPNKRVFVESESHKLGKLSIPIQLWEAAIGTPSKVIYLDISLEDRIDFLMEDYALWTTPGHRHVLEEKLGYLVPLVGKSLYTEWMTLINKGDYRGFLASVLEKHYDLTYSKSRSSRSQLGREKLVLDKCDATLLM